MYRFQIRKVNKTWTFVNLSIFYILNGTNKILNAISQRECIRALNLMWLEIKQQNRVYCFLGTIWCWIWAHINSSLQRRGGGGAYRQLSSEIWSNFITTHSTLLTPHQSYLIWCWKLQINVHNFPIDKVKSMRKVRIVFPLQSRMKC